MPLNERRTADLRARPFASDSLVAGRPLEACGLLLLVTFSLQGVHCESRREQIRAPVAVVYDAWPRAPLSPGWLDNLHGSSCSKSSLSGHSREFRDRAVWRDIVPLVVRRHYTPPERSVDLSQISAGFELCTTPAFLLRPDTGRMQVTDLSGRTRIALMLSGGDRQLDVSTLENGLYLVQYQTDGTIWQGKLVVQH